MPDKLLRVALYIRVSTDRQAKEGESLEAQETALTKYAKENNYLIHDTYIDEGESGQKLKRTNLTRLLEDVKQNKIDLILITKLDRWFRSIADFYKVQEILNKHNVKWNAIWEDYDTTTASGEMWLNMSLSLGQMEAKRTGERIDAVFEHKFKVQKTVCSGAVPYGYKISDEKKLIIDEEKAEHIRQLYSYYIKTNSLCETVRWFQNNITKRSYDSIKIYLRNTAYIGLYKRNKDKVIIEDFAPRIIDDETFYQVQELLKKNIKQKKHSNTKPYIFTGLLKCAECGNNLTGTYSFKGEYHYYRCKKAYESIYCDNKKSFNEKKIEKYLLENIKKEMSLKIKKVNKPIKKKVDTSKKIKSKLEKLVELYTNDLIDIDYYKKQYDELSKQLSKEQKNKKDVIIDTTKIEKFLKSDFLAVYSTLDNLEKRRLWASIIDYIEIDNDKNYRIKLL